MDTGTHMSKLPEKACRELPQKGACRLITPIEQTEKLPSGSIKEVLIEKSHLSNRQISCLASPACIAVCLEGDSLAVDIEHN